MSNEFDELKNMVKDLVTTQLNRQRSDEILQANIAQSNELLRAKIQLTDNAVGGLSKQYVELSDDVSNIKNRMYNYEQNEEITDEQALNLLNKLHYRVCEILNFNGELIDKYFRVYIKDLYKTLKHSYNMGSKYRTTKKKHYDTVMRGIEAWFPDEEKLKERVNNRLERKCKIKETNFEDYLSN